MRLLIVLLTLVFAALGAMFGALNSDWIELDFYMLTVSAPKGASLLLALLVGWILGGCMVWLVRIPGLKRELRRARQRTTTASSTQRKSPAKGTGGDE